MELAALARENGLEVDLWEADAELGGQLRYAVRAPRHEGYADYLRWQEQRLADLGVRVRRGTRATADDVVAAGADTVAIATGAGPRRPDIPGADAAHVLDIRDVLAGRVTAGHRVLVIAQDDHVAPLSVADFLAERRARRLDRLCDPTAGTADGPLHHRRASSAASTPRTSG